jgi:hypothetical protein
MSYGEATLLPDYGRFVDLVNEVFSWDFDFNCTLYMCVCVYIFFFYFLIIEVLVVLHLGGEQASSDICEQRW